MNREQARKWFQSHKTSDPMVNEAFDIAIEALQAEPNKAVPPSLADVYKWERDVALSQLEEYGIGFAEKKRDDLVEVVRCKDCIHRQTYMCPMYREEWYTIEEGDGYFVDDDFVVFDCTVDDGYCYLGERKNNAVEESEAEK